jgi:hypothetical protein
MIRDWPITARRTGSARVEALLLLVIALAAGAVGGAGAMYYLHPAHAPAATSGRPGFGMGAGAGMPPVYERLDLTARQRADIERILDDARPRTDSILDASLPALRAVVESTQVRVRGVLTPLQRERLDTLLARPPIGRGPVRTPGAPGAMDRPARTIPPG